MKMESIKLSPKKSGNGYASGYSISIGKNEAELCQLTNQRIIKYVDDEKHEITIRAKQYTLTNDIIRTVCEMKNSANREDSVIYKKYFNDAFSVSGAELMEKMLVMKEDGVVNNAEIELQQDLSELPIETIADLCLLMYMGRDLDADMRMNAGEERFLEFCDRYNYIVLGKDKHVIIDNLMEKKPLTVYLKSGVKVLFAPKGTDINDLPRLDWSDYPDTLDLI